jgi:hypothetical protein
LLPQRRRARRGHRRPLLPLRRHRSSLSRPLAFKPAVSTWVFLPLLWSADAVNFPPTASTHMHTAFAGHIVGVVFPPRVLQWHAHQPDCVPSFQH